MSDGRTGDREQESTADDRGTAVPDGFVRENREYVRSLSEALLALDGGGLDREGIDGAFRAAHSLKSNCQDAGLDGAAALAHAVEDVLEAVRSGRLRADRLDTDEALAAVEDIGAAIDRARGGRADIDPTDRVERLRAALDDGGPGGNGSGAAAGDGTTERGSSGSAGEGPGPDENLDPEVREALAAASDYDDLDTLVETVDGADAFSGLEGGGSFDGLRDDSADGPPDGDGLAVTHSDADGAEDPNERDDGPAGGGTERGRDRSVDLVPAADTSRADDGVRVPGAGPAVDAAPTIAASSLDGDRFGAADAADGVRDGSPESPVSALEPIRSLAVERRRLATVLAEQGVEDARVRDALESLRTAADDLGGVATDQWFARADLLVPDLERTAEVAARRTGTAVAFRTETNDTAFPRGVLDRLADPLCHLVRNAVDHGIEPPAERADAGKPREGRVTFRVRRDGGDLVVSVADDGRGIDPDAVREAAVEAGLVEDADALSEERAREALFEAGLSTAAETSEVSGRGVGMDVVADAAAALDGSVTLESTPGEGTTVRLRVPVPLAVLGVTFVAVGHETYGVPAGAVRAVVPATEATELGDGRIRPSVPVEDDGGEPPDGTAAYRVVDLAAVLSVPEEPPDDHGGTGAATAPSDLDEGSVYLLVEEGPSSEAAPVALRCDGVRDEHETLVTPLRCAGPPWLDAVAVRDAGRAVVLLAPDGLSDRE